MAWTWWAVPGSLSPVLAWSAALVVLRTAPRRSLNRRLGLVLLLEGAVQDGEVTRKEQEILSRLRQKLEISPAEAARAEHEVLSCAEWCWSGEPLNRG